VVPRFLDLKKIMFELESDHVSSNSSSIEDYNESIGSEKLANSIQKEDGKI